jgi:hypothetical protein
MVRHNCKFIGVIGLDYVDNGFGSTVRTAFFRTAPQFRGPTRQVSSPAQGSMSPNHFYTPLSVGLWGGQGNIMNCHAIGYDVGFCIPGLS